MPEIEIYAYISTCLRMICLLIFICLFLFIYFFDFIYLFLERGGGREKEEERNINVWLPLALAPTGDLACNPGMCPAWELNLWAFGSQAGTQSTEPHQPGVYWFFRERERERQTSISCLPYPPLLGTEPATYVCALTGYQTSNLSVHGMILQPTEPHWLAWAIFWERCRMQGYKKYWMNLYSVGEKEMKQEGGTEQVL